MLMWTRTRLSACFQNPRWPSVIVQPLNQWRQGASESFFFFFFNDYIIFGCWIGGEREREDEEEGFSVLVVFSEHCFLMPKHRQTFMYFCMMGQKGAPHFLDRLPDRTVWQRPAPVWCWEWLNEKQRQLWDYRDLCKACFIPQLTVWGSCVRQQRWITNEIISLCYLSLRWQKPDPQLMMFVYFHTKNV